MRAGGDARCAAGGGRPPGDPLVSYRISAHDSEDKALLYPRTIKRKRPGFVPSNPPPDRSGSELQGFSKQSRSRLRFTVENAPTLQRCAQFVGTYHDLWPVNGREFKRHLKIFLDRLRRRIPFLEYVWAAEFQTRGAPHFHLFLNIEPSEENRRLLGSMWNQIADPGSEYHRWWHVDRVDHDGRSALIPWEMASGYLCKYLDKEHQKMIPDGFRNFGRWWGNSQGLVPPPEETSREQVHQELPTVDEGTGEEHPDAWKFLMRTVGRYHEHQNRRSWFRKTNRSTSALTGAPIFRQTLEYLRRTRGTDDESHSPF